MIKITLCALSLVSILSLQGCAAVNDAFTAGAHDVDCTAIYTTHQGAAYEPYYATIPIVKVRIDHNGDYWVRPKNTLYVRFFPGWKSPEHFSNFQCNGNDYGLRGATIRR